MQASRRRISLGLAATGLMAGSRAARAQAFPARPLKIIVPFPAGGTTDVVARMVAQRMSESMGQPVVVENRGGAGGAIGADVVAKSAPDGYTLLMHNLTFPMTSVAQTLAGRATFNAETDLAGVSISVYVPFMWTAHPGVPARDLRELGQLLRTQKLFCFAVTMIMGGALGNVVDRLLHGYVVDFLQFRFRILEPLFPGGYFPSFNVADSAITLGAICLILDEILRVRRAK